MSSARICSGDMYRGVPSTRPSSVRMPEAETFAMPKSTSLGVTSPSGSTERKMFAGVTSRCTTPHACAWARADSSGTAMATASLQLSVPCRRSHFSSDSPRRSSITRTSAPSGSSSRSKTRTMLRWTSMAPSFASWRNRASASWFDSARWSSFIATNASVVSLRATHTSPMPPIASRRTSLYLRPMSFPASSGAGPLEESISARLSHDTACRAASVVLWSSLPHTGQGEGPGVLGDVVEEARAPNRVDDLRGPRKQPVARVTDGLPGFVIAAGRIQGLREREPGVSIALLDVPQGLDQRYGLLRSAERFVRLASGEIDGCERRKSRGAALARHPRDFECRVRVLRRRVEAPRQSEGERNVAVTAAQVPRVALRTEEVDARVQERDGLLERAAPRHDQAQVLPRDRSHRGQAHPVGLGESSAQRCLRLRVHAELLLCVANGHELLAYGATVAHRREVAHGLLGPLEEAAGVAREDGLVGARLRESGGDEGVASFRRCGRLLDPPDEGVRFRVKPGVMQVHDARSEPVELSRPCLAERSSRAESIDHALERSRFRESSVCDEEHAGDSAPADAALGEEPHRGGPTFGDRGPLAPPLVHLELQA